ncbi:MAG TPA: beta-propeller fold lactonase family protein, partial [Bryobacteraceae bacterium]|nr:beta-propeller fold lactonase family protein [Bryobacteraceae bacterium]
MISRRGLLLGAGALAARAEAKRPLLAYVGSYSSPQGPEGSHGNGQGIYLFEMNTTTGALAQRAVFLNPSNPSWLAFDPRRTHVYSANETADGSASAYAVDRANGHLVLLNTVSSEGAGPAHLSVHPSGKFVLVANYAGGTVAVLPILADGKLGKATDVKHDQGPVGPVHAASAPPGSFAISGHDRVHAHMIQSDPSGRYVLS